MSNSGRRVTIYQRAYFDLAPPLLEVPAGKRGKDEDQSAW
jgi:hypothetical protein